MERRLRETFAAAAVRRRCAVGPAQVIRTGRAGAHSRVRPRRAREAARLGDRCATAGLGSCISVPLKARQRYGRRAVARAPRRRRAYDDERPRRGRRTWPIASALSDRESPAVRGGAGALRADGQRQLRQHARTAASWPATRRSRRCFGFEFDRGGARHAGGRALYVDPTDARRIARRSSACRSASPASKCTLRRRDGRGRAGRWQTPSATFDEPGELVKIARLPHRSDGAEGSRGAAASGAAARGRRPAGRRHRPRLQQPADRHHRLRRSAAARRPRRCVDDHDHARRAGARRPSAAARSRSSCWRSAGGRCCSRACCDLNDALRSAQSMLRRLAAADTVVLMLDLDPRDRAGARSIPDQLDQVIVNLVVNAVRCDAGRRDAHRERRAASRLTSADVAQYRDDDAGALRRRSTVQRHGRRHGRGDARARVRAVLHDQARRQGHRPRACRPSTAS